MLIPFLFGVLDMLPLPEPPAAEAPRWRIVKTEQGITCRIALVDGARVPWGEAVAEIARPLEEVASHLLDFEGARKFIPRAAEIRTLERGPDQALVYYRIHLLWPISDRDWTIRYRFSMSEQKGFEMIWSELNDLGPRVQDTVRVTLVRGLWQLTATAHKTTHARYVVLSDLGGRLPMPVIEQTAWRQPLETIKGIRRALGVGP